MSGTTQPSWAGSVDLGWEQLEIECPEVFDCLRYRGSRPRAEYEARVFFEEGGREAHASVRLVLETVRSVEELHAKAVARQERLESESTRPPEG